jgi:hypothetical protein
MGWEELEWKCKKLKKLNWKYTVLVGRKMFALQVPEYQFTLVKWGHQQNIVSWAPKREVLYEGHDYQAVLGFVSMLLTAEEELR